MKTPVSDDPWRDSREATEIRIQIFADSPSNLDECFQSYLKVKLFDRLSESSLSSLGSVLYEKKLVVEINHSFLRDGVRRALSKVPHTELWYERMSIIKDRMKSAGDYKFISQFVSRLETNSEWKNLTY